MIYLIYFTNESLADNFMHNITASILKTEADKYGYKGNGDKNFESDIFKSLACNGQNKSTILLYLLQI